MFEHIHQTNNVGLSDDLLIEILTKLPLKCVYRCKCVSRSWQRLITDRYFATRVPFIFSGVFYRCGGVEFRLEPRYGCNSDGSFQETDLSYLPFHHNSSIIDCSNGLLLFYRSLPSAFHVCNPTTKRWVALPKPRSKSQLSILAFDPCKSLYYKVVCFSGWLAQGGQLEVFSSETGRWVEHSLHWGIESNKLSASMHYFDGILYVLAHPRHVACIDLEKMCCSVMELPDDMNNDASLGNCGGFLHCTMNDANELRIWVLKGLNWVLKNIVSIAGVLGGSGGCRDVVSAGVLQNGQFNILAFHPKEEMVYIWVLGKVVTYDLRKKRFGFVCELGTEKEKEKVQLIQIWLFPFSGFVSDCLACV